MDTKKRSRTRRSKTEQGELVAAWRESGKSVSAFAAEHGLASSTLYQWIHPTKRGAKGESAGKRRKRKSSPKATFTEVSVVGQAAAARGPAMTVALRSGHSVTFECAPVDLAWLGSVLKVVSTC